MRITVIALAALLLPAAAHAQSYPASPSRCGQAFQPTVVSYPAFAIPCSRFAEGERVKAAAKASATCAARFGSSCGKAVTVTRNPVTTRVVRRVIHLCELTVKDVYRCQATVKQPDLEVKRFSARVTSAGDTTLDLQICNKGTAAATFEAAIDFPQTPTTLGICARPLPPGATNGFLLDVGGVSLAAGACVSAALPLGPLPAGAYGMTFWVDPRCRLTESDERNNYRHLTVDVRPREADVRASIKLVPGYPKGTTVAYDITVCRSGPETRPMQVVVTPALTRLPRPSAPGYCRTYYGPTYSDIIRDVTLPAGCTTVRFETDTFSRATPGSRYRGCIILDQRCVVTERDEANNVACTSATFVR